MNTLETARAPLSRRKRFTFILTAVVLLYLIFEALSFGGLAVLARWRGIRYEPLRTVLSDEQKNFLKERLQTFEATGNLPGYHPVLGWTLVQGTRSPNGMYRINDAGIRSDREISIQPNRLLRIAAFGDSFTYGAGVNNEDTWEEQLSRSHPGIEVLNFGVGAYGLDQAYLRYGVDGTAYRSDIVIIGFMSENILRNVNVFRPFYDSSYRFNLLTKPRFILDRGQLVRLENPLQTVQDFRRLVNEDRQVLSEFGRNDYHYLRRYQEGAFDFLPSVRFGKAVTQFLRRRLSNDEVVVNGLYNTNSEAFKVTEKIFDEFYRAALTNGSLPIIVVFPDLGDFRTFLQGHRVRYQPLLDVFGTKGYRFVDSMKSFTDYDPQVKVKDLTADGYGHYSRLGNSIIAGSLLRFLEQHGLTSREFVKQKIKEERARLGLIGEGDGADRNRAG